MKVEDRGLHEEGWVMGRKRMGRSDKPGSASRQVRYWYWCWFWCSLVVGWAGTGTEVPAWDLPGVPFPVG